MTLHHILLTRLCRDAGYGIDLDVRAIATSIDTALVLPFLQAAYALAAAQLAAEWTTEAVSSTHDMIGSLETGELDVEATYLSNAVAARKRAADDLEQRQLAFAAACEELFKFGELLLTRDPAQTEVGR
ncbi:hypothetical protein [Longispora urticae]